MPKPYPTGSSSVAASASSFVDETGAGGSATVTAISDDGQISTSSDSVYTPGATSSNASAQGKVSADEPPSTSANASAPAAIPFPDSYPEKDSNPSDSSPNSAENSSQDATPVATPSKPENLPVEPPKMMEPPSSSPGGEGENPHGSLPNSGGSSSSHETPVEMGELETPSSSAAQPDDPSISDPISDSSLVISGSSENDRMLGSSSRDRMLGGDGDDSLAGGTENDELSGNVGRDWLEGNQGNDSLQGGQGNDILIGGEGDDNLLGNLENDYLHGNQGEDRLKGGDGDDTLRGGRGNDDLIGGAGNDVLIGDFGRDRLTGEAGADTFVLRTETAAGDLLLADRIADFQAAEGDKIGITGGISVEMISFEAIDSDSDGLVDATVLRLNDRASDAILGIVMNSVDTAGKTVLTSNDLISVANI